MYRKKSIYPMLATICIVFLLVCKISTAQVSDSKNQPEVFESFTDDFAGNQFSACEGCSSAATCSPGSGSEIAAPLWLKYAIISSLILVLAIYLKKKFGWASVGIILMLFLFGFHHKNHVCTIENTKNENKILLASASITKPEESPAGNTFSDFPDNEFKESGNDEFSEFNTGDIESSDNSDGPPYSLLKDKNFTVSVTILVATLLAGVMVKFRTTRKLRVFFLISSVVYLGFINGGCPCMISSFQNVVLFFAGVPVKPVLFLWFIGLIPLTYFFGKVWCGWVCHLGALQEFIYRPGILRVLQSEKSQNVLKTIRIFVLLVLVAQVFITKTNIFIHYDPFKVAFNLFSANIAGYILLAVLLISSLLIYRPFCRSVCPVGLILGWVTRIPGSLKLTKNNSCIDCKSCSNACKYNAMVYENKKSYLNNDDCILCGDCIDSCKFNSLEIKQFNVKQ